MKRLVVSAILGLSLFVQNVNAQGGAASNESIAIVSVDATGSALNNLEMASLLRLELVKSQKYEVLDKYDVEAKVQSMGIDPVKAFGKSQLVALGKEIKADYMLTGSVQTVGTKTIFILRLIDVDEEKIIKSDVKEYVYDENYLQTMARISVQSLLGMDIDAETFDRLTNVDKPIVSQGKTLKLSGPRFGMQFFSGKVAERLSAPESEGGYASTPYATVFGYQHEIQYVSSGEFQALVEVIGTINGIETKYVSPSLTLLNGLRFKGWEIGFGPVFRFSKIAEGFYDNEGKWNLGIPADDSGFDLVNNIDSRGDLNLSTGLVIAVGKSFRSGHINLPVNVFYSHIPAFDSHVVGFMLGFNIATETK